MTPCILFPSILVYCTGCCWPFILQVMTYTRPIPPDNRALGVYLRKECHASFRQIARQCGMSKSSAQRLCQDISLPRGHQNAVGKRTGRPRKVDERNVRSMIRNLKQLRAKNVNFTVKQLVEESGLNFTGACQRTFSRRLNEKGYYFLQSRKKGLLTEKDKKARLAYARRMKRLQAEDCEYWKNSVAFYLDGVSFIHKFNPMSAATAPKAKVWRKKGEGLEITAKGTKDLAGGRRLHVIVAVAFGKGVVLREPYCHMNGRFFARFITQHFNNCFARCGPKAHGRRIFVMDNDPSQTSRTALNALTNIEAEFHKLPPRSPDLTPVESVFNILKRKLDDQAISKEITQETFEDFETRVLETMDNLDVDLIDRTIGSMWDRINAVIKGKGSRTKY